MGCEGKAGMTSDTKRERAVAAAADQFLRYGYNRTRMGDIARACGMSRPALYLLFPSKDDAFNEAVLHLNSLRTAEITAAVAAAEGLAERLFTACSLWLLRVFELQLTTPDARDMDDLSFPVVREVYAALQHMLATILAEARGAALPAPSEVIARNLVFSLRGLSAAARDVDDFARMMRLQVDLFCAAIEQGAPAGRPAAVIPA